MKLSRIDYIGLNGNDGLHYKEEEIKQSLLDKLSFDHKGFIYLTKREVAEIAYDLAIKVKHEK